MRSPRLRVELGRDCVTINRFSLFFPSCSRGVISVSRSVVWTIAALSILVGRGFADDAPSLKDSVDGWLPLFNGQDLTGWEVKDGKRDAWVVDQGMLSCIADGGGWLRSSRMYSDFILKLEYRIPPGGNSGVGLRFPAEGDPAHAGMEIQILDDDADQHKDLLSTQYTGGIYYQAAAKRGVAKSPGEWNVYEITCRGAQIKVVLNGEVVNEVAVDKFTKGEGGHAPLAERPQIGYIGFQSHGARVDFRNLFIRDLTASMKSGVRYIDIVTGKGSLVAPGATVVVHFTGRLVDGRKFDASRDHTPPRPLTCSLEDVIAGWQEGLPGMRVGGQRKLVIPPGLAYGERAREKIPANSTLIFDVEVLEVR
jgi:hypothetical protein